MTGKERMRVLLDGGVPDVPPHWELAFQIEETFLGMRFEPLREEDFESPEAKERVEWLRQMEVMKRLVEEVDWAVVPGGYDAGRVRVAHELLGHKAMIAGYEGDGVFWMPNGNDMMDFAVKLHEHRDGLLEEAREKCERAKQSLRDMTSAGADFFVGTYDFGFNDAPFVSPKDFQEIVAPFLAEIVNTSHELGKKMILHSDGCLTKVLDQIHATGIDGYQSVDPQGGMDIRKVREKYPEWLLMGNVACNMLQDVNEERIRDSVRYCMTYGGVGKRYIFSTSNCIFRGMPAESYRVMVDEYQRICRKDSVDSLETRGRI